MGGRGARQPHAVVAVERTRTLRHDRPAPKRRKQVDGRRVMASGSLLVLLLGTLAGLVWGFQADTFRVREVSINGASSAVRQAITDLVVPGCVELVPGSITCSNATLGPNELTLRTAEVEAQLIKQVPLVKSARVKAVLPNKLEISVTERLPQAAWVVGTDIFRVADDGKIIDRGSADGLKVIIGQVAGEPKKPGDSVKVDVIKAAELLQERLPGELGIPARRIQYSDADGLAVVGDQDFIAMFGQPQDLNLKMAELQRIVQLARDKKTTLAFVDLRYKTPYFRTR